MFFIDAYDSFTHNLVHGLTLAGAHVTVVRCDEVTAEELAVPLATINYEIPCAITPRVPRAYRS